MSEDLVLEVLAQWPRRWTYPALAIDLTEGTVDADTAARRILDGLARPRGLVDSVLSLVEEGSYEKAESVLLEMLDARYPEEGALWLDGESWALAESTLTAAREHAVADMSRRSSDLAVRADAVGVDLPELGPLTELTSRSLTQARVLLAELDKRVTKAESERCERIEARLDEAVLAAGAGFAVDSWASAVRDCLRAGEYQVADRMVTEGPYRTIEAGPRSVPPPPLTWPWPEYSTAEVLTWYEDQFAAPGPEFSRFQVERSDTPARELLNSLSRLTEGVDALAVRDFATALAALLGESVAPEVHEVREAGNRLGFRTTLFGLVDPRLPGLPLMSPRGVTLWVGEVTGSDTFPLPSAEPAIWFRPELRSSSKFREKIANLDVATLLRVIAPDVNNRQTRPGARRINLLRLLIPRFDVAAALGSAPVALGTGASRRDSLAWLFDLFGLLPDGPVLDSLLHDSDGHPLVLRELLAALLTGSSDHGRVRQTGLALARAPEVRRDARARVLDSLVDHPVAKAVLMFMLEMPNGTDRVRVDQVADGIVKIAQASEDERVERLPIGEAFGTLVSLGLARPFADDMFLLPGPGLRDLLRGDRSPRGLRDDLVAALENASEQLRQARLATEGRIAARVSRLIGHGLDNEVLAISGLLNAARSAVPDQAVGELIDAVLRRMDKLSGGAYLAAYDKALNRPEPVDVRDLVRAVIGDVELQLSSGIRIADISTDLQPVLVWTNRFIMEENLRSMMLNAVRALEAHMPPDGGLVAIHVQATGDDSSGPPTVAEPRVVIEVHDNGPGFTPEALTLYQDIAAKGVAWSDPALGGRHGTGIRQAVAWLGDYGGRLELPTRSDRFGGGCVRI